MESSSIFETCQYSFMDDYWTAHVLEKFQSEIGQRILKLSNFHANDVIRIGPTMATRILTHSLANCYQKLRTV